MEIIKIIQITIHMLVCSDWIENRTSDNISDISSDELSLQHPNF